MQKQLTVEASGQFLLGGELPIYRLGFGAMRITGPNIWGYPKNIDEAQHVLRRAIEMGINFIDTADSYGPEVSENLIAATFYPYPSHLVIATKGGLLRPSPGEWVPDCRPEYLIQCVEKSLQRLKLKCIDLYQLHAVDRKVPIEDSVRALREMQQQGKIRYIGLSNVSVSEIERAKKIVDVVSVQNRYNIFDRESESVLEYCEKHQLAFIPWFPLGSGDLIHEKRLASIAKRKQATPAQIALAWLLKRSPAMVPIPGTSSIKHLEENVAAVNIKLTDEEFDELTE